MSASGTSRRSMRPSRRSSVFFSVKSFLMTRNALERCVDRRTPSAPWFCLRAGSAKRPSRHFIGVSVRRSGPRYPRRCRATSRRSKRGTKKKIIARAMRRVFVSFAGKTHARRRSQRAQQGFTSACHLSAPPGGTVADDVNVLAPSVCKCACVRA